MTNPVSDLAAEIETLFAAGAAADSERARAAFGRLRAALSAGEARAAEPDPAAADSERARAAFGRLRAALSAGEARAAEPDPAAASGWRVNAWVKQGILLGFRFGRIVDMSADHGRWPFADKDTMPLKPLDAAK